MSQRRQLPVFLRSKLSIVLFAQYNLTAFAGEGNTTRVSLKHRRRETWGQVTQLTCCPAWMIDSQALLLTSSGLIVLHGMFIWRYNKTEIACQRSHCPRFRPPSFSNPSTPVVTFSCFPIIRPRIQTLSQLSFAFICFPPSRLSLYPHPLNDSVLLLIFSTLWF